MKHTGRASSVSPQEGNGRAVVDARWLWGSPAFSAATAVLSYVQIADPATNDFERFENLPLLGVFCLVFVGWLAWYVRLGLAPEQFVRSQRQFWVVWLASALCLLASFPVGSRDVFAYAFYGKLWAVHGVEPSVTPPTAFQQDAWFPLLQAWWKEGAAGYGPLFLLQTRWVGVLAGESWPLAVALFKVQNFLLLVGSIWILERVARCRAEGEETSHGPRGVVASSTAIWALNPLVLFESLSSAHNDLAMAVLLMAAVLCWERGWWGGSVALWALSFWYKWYSLLSVPLWLFWWWWRVGAARMGWGLLEATLVFALVSVVLLAPFGTVAGEFLWKPWTIGVGSMLMPTELPPTLWPLFGLFLESGWFSLETGRRLFDSVRYGCLAMVFVVLLWRRRAMPYRPGVLAVDLCWSLLGFFAFAITVLWPWHLLAPVALAAMSNRGAARGLIVVVSSVAFLSYFLTFALAAVGVGVGVAIWWFGEQRRQGQGERTNAHGENG